MKTRRELFLGWIAIVVLVATAIGVCLVPFPALADTKTLQFAWEQAAADTQKADFGGWKLYGKTQSETTFRLLATVNYGGSQQDTYTTSQPIESPGGAETPWVFYLTAFDRNGNESAPSAHVAWAIDFAPPTVPVNLRITVVPAGN